MDNSKKLYIIRHAKAETIPGINDFDRALTSVTIYGIWNSACKTGCCQACHKIES